MRISANSTGIVAAAERLQAEIAVAVDTAASELLSVELLTSAVEEDRERQLLSRQTALVRIALLTSLRPDLAGHVAQARDAGATWQEVADAAGMTRQSAHEQWGHS